MLMGSEQEFYDIFIGLLFPLIECITYLIAIQFEIRK